MQKVIVLNDNTKYHIVSSIVVSNQQRSLCSQFWGTNIVRYRKSTLIDADDDSSEFKNLVIA